MNEKEIEQTEKKSIKKLIQRKSILFLLSITLAFLLYNSQISNHLSTTAYSFGADSSFTNGGLAINEQIHVEGFLEWDGISSFGTIMQPIGSVIQVNCTVLAFSNSSVFLVPYSNDYSYALFDPSPNNLTLAPGESFAETYTIVGGMSEQHAEFGFYVSVITENSNATVHWWYEVLVTGKYSTAGFLLLSGTIILISLGAIFHSKRKAIRNRK